MISKVINLFDKYKNGIFVGTLAIILMGVYLYAMYLDGMKWDGVYRYEEEFQVVNGKLVTRTPLTDEELHIQLKNGCKACHSDK